MNKLIEYRRGNMPLIISVPHGGSLILQDIPNRDFGSYKKDKETVLTLKEIIKAFETKGLRPYVVQMNVHRRKIDVNRGTKEGAQDPDMLKLHRQYHECLKQARGEVFSKFGGGILIDLHGQSYRKGFVEIGYSLSIDDIKNLDNLSLAYIKKESTFRSLILKGISPKDIVFGKNSLGELLSVFGYKVTPTWGYPLAEEDKHFNGVYILHRHVVTKDENIFGANLELCYAGIRDTAKNRQKFAKAFSAAIIKFLKNNYKMSFPWKKTS